MITASELGSKLGVHSATIRKHAARLGIKRVGTGYALTVADSRRILRSIEDARTGNPLMFSKSGQKKLRKQRHG